MREDLYTNRQEARHAKETLEPEVFELCLLDSFLLRDVEKD